MKSFYKFRSAHNLDRIADILINQRLYCCPIDHLNDPMEGFFHAHLKDQGFCTLAIKNNPNRICSLSENMHDIRLWTFYANNHRGVAIKFAPDKEVERVQYDSTLFTIDSLESTRNQLRRGINFTKLNHWHYEEEYRYLTCKKDEEYLSGKVLQVIFGIRISKTTKSIIKALCRERQIPTSDATLDNKKYTINEKK